MRANLAPFLDMRESPHPHPIFRRGEQRLPGLDLKGRVPGVEISHRQGAILRRRMAIGDDFIAQRRLAQLLEPTLSKAHEEQLSMTTFLDGDSAFVGQVS
jgi:hypothetical protein